jgi:cation transport ATPase
VLKQHWILTLGTLFVLTGCFLPWWIMEGNFSEFKERLQAQEPLKKFEQRVGTGFDRLAEKQVQGLKEMPLDSTQKQQALARAILFQDSVKAIVHREFDQLRTGIIPKEEERSELTPSHEKEQKEQISFNGMRGFYFQITNQKRAKKLKEKWKESRVIALLSFFGTLVFTALYFLTYRFRSKSLRITQLIIAQIMLTAFSVIFVMMVFLSVVGRSLFNNAIEGQLDVTTHIALGAVLVFLGHILQLISSIRLYIQTTPPKLL